MTSGAWRHRGRVPMAGETSLCDRGLRIRWWWWWRRPGTAYTQRGLRHAVLNEPTAGSAVMLELTSPARPHDQDGDPRDGMIRIPGGTFRMGSDKHYPEEAPVHRVDRRRILDRPHAGHQPAVQGSSCDATGHVTFAEIPPDPKDYPGALPHMLYAGSLVFTPPSSRSTCATGAQWWTFLKGADWRHPYGPKQQHQRAATIIRSCMSRYRRCARPMRDGPARNCRPRRNGSSPRAAASTAPNSPGAMSSRPAASTWPTPGRANSRARTCADGFERTSPVTAFPPNGYGLHDMIGNVWEWTTDWYSPKHEADAPKACCIPENPRGGREDASYDPRQPQHQDSAQGDQGRLASVRAELLPPLPPGRAPRASRSTRRPAMSDSAASSRKGAPHEQRPSRDKPRRCFKQQRAPDRSGATCCWAAPRWRPRRRWAQPASPRTAQAQQTPAPVQRRRQAKPNILVIFGDDVGVANISAYSNGLMGYETPNIDRIGREGIKFLHYYGEQSAPPAARRSSPASTSSAPGSPRSASPARRWA